MSLKKNIVLFFSFQFYFRHKHPETIQEYFGIVLVSYFCFCFISHIHCTYTHTRKHARMHARTQNHSMALLDFVQDHVGEPAPER